MKLISKEGYGIFVRGDSVFFTTGDHFYQYDLSNVNEITRLEYLIEKYGEENKYWKQTFGEFVRLSNGHFITTYYQENEMRLHKSNGQVQKKLEKINSPWGMGIYGMSIDRNENLWIAVPVEHYVGKFNIETEEEIFSICGKEMEPTTFNHPEHITIINEFAYVSDMGNRRIVKIHTENHDITNYKQVKEPIYYFNQLNGKNIYLLKTGIYIE